MNQADLATHVYKANLAHLRNSFNWKIMSMMFWSSSWWWKWWSWHLICYSESWVLEGSENGGSARHQIFPSIRIANIMTEVGMRIAMRTIIEYQNPPNNKHFYRTLVLSLPGLVRYLVMLTNAWCFSGWWECLELELWWWCSYWPIVKLDSKLLQTPWPQMDNILTTSWWQFGYTIPLNYLL